jgi:hypothetical protein
MQSPIIKYVLIVALMLGLIVMCSLPVKIYGQLPLIKYQGDIAYINGGVERDEAKAIHADAKNWPLSIEFFEYLVDQRLWIGRVYLSIRDGNGKSIFEDSLDGPMFLAKLPSGNYEIIATHNGVTKTQKVQVVAGRPINVCIYWGLSKNRHDYPYFSPWGFWF